MNREENRKPAMAGLAIAVVLLVVGLWLARELTAASKMQDCLMSGRTNCNVDSAAVTAVAFAVGILPWTLAAE